MDRACVPFEFERGGARPRIPNLHSPVATDGEDAGAVGAERRAPRPLVYWEFEQGGARPRVPDLRRRRSVLTVGGEAAGDDARAVRAERHAPNKALVPDEIERGRARPRVPDHRRPVVASGGDERGVGAEQRACHFARGPFDFEQGLARPRVANLNVGDVTVVTSGEVTGEDTPAVRAEPAAKVPFELEQE